MIKSRFFAAITAAGVLISTSAFALNWTSNYRNISEIRQSGGKDGYEILFTTPLAGSNDNPMGCTDNLYAEPDPTLTAAQKELLSRTVLAALMAGKMIKLHIKESACINNRPVYQGVRIARDS